MAETQTYSHAEMLQYLQQKMSQQEMHDFEKALMNDPFLADAFEGFVASDAVLASEHIAAIEKSLINDEQEAKVVPLMVKKTAWWKIAAIVLLVVSASVVAYSILQFNPRNEQQLATKAVKPFTQEKDSIRPADKPLAKIEIASAGNSFKHANNTSPIIHNYANKSSSYQRQLNKSSTALYDSDKEKAPLIASSAPAPVNESKELAAASMIKQNKGEAVVMGYGTQRKTDITAAIAAQNENAQNVFKGRVVDKSGEPLPFADIKAINPAVATKSDVNGNFSLKAPDSLLEVNVTSTGYTAARAKIASNKNDNKIQLKEDELSLAEVVVSNLSKKRKGASVYVNLDTTITAEPVGGWKNLRQYLNHEFDNLNLNEGNQNLNKDLILEFSINEQGKPTEIKIPAATDKRIAEKIIKIISNGPLWKNGKKDTKVKVVISF